MTNRSPPRSVSTKVSPRVWPNAYWLWSRCRRTEPQEGKGCERHDEVSDVEARRLFTSVQQSFTNMFRGTRGLLQPPIDDIETYWTPGEKAQVSNMLACSFVGSREMVRADLEAFLHQTDADEFGERTKA